MKHKTIRNHRDFITSKDDILEQSVCFNLKIKNQSVPGEIRYGIIASKRVFRTAVDRNLAKRKMRDWIAYNEELMNLNVDYIFFVNEQILDYPRDIGRKDVREAMENIADAYNNQDV